MKRALVLVGVLGAAAHADPPPAPDPALPRISVLVAPGIVAPSSAIGSEDVSASLFVDVGVRVPNDVPTEVGVHVGGAWLSGTGTDDLGATYRYRLVPLALAGFARATAYDVLWGEVSLGLHFDHVSGDVPPGWFTSFGLGLAAGVDLVRIRFHKVGVFGALDVGKGDISYSGASAGLFYRE